MHVAVVCLRRRARFALYARRRALRRSCPSYEGFGLTPLEALAAGMPIVVLDTPVAREMYAEAALYVTHARTRRSSKTALERVLFDRRERARLLEAAGTCWRATPGARARRPRCSMPSWRAAPDAMPRLSIVIVTYNSPQRDRRLPAVADGRGASSSSTRCWSSTTPRSDGTADAVRAALAPVRVIDAGGNLGFARANNIGIRRQRGELVLLLNPDTVVPPRRGRPARRSLDALPDAAMAGPGSSTDAAARSCRSAG